MEIFEDIGGEFEGRLRSCRMAYRTVRVSGEELTLSTGEATIEARFSLKVLDRLHEPAYIGIKRMTSNGETFLVYQTTGVSPVHFQMLGMGISVPKVIRREFLETIDRGWGASEETWIDILAVPTGYRMDIVGGYPRFERSNLTPLVGGEARILSKEAVRAFLCVDKGSEVGEIKGLGIPLTVKMDEIVKYHSGLFGFTGCGKSNFTSYLIRQTVSSMNGISVVVFDVSGEYLIHLLDLEPDFVSTETFDSADKILDAQAIPESLEAMRGRMKGIIESLISSRRIERLSLRSEADFSLGDLYSFFESLVEEGKDAEQAKVALRRLDAFSRSRGYPQSKPLREIAGDGEALGELLGIIEEFKSMIHGMGATLKRLAAVEKFITDRSLDVEGEGSLLTPEDLARRAVSDGGNKIFVVYAPEPIEARRAVSRFVKELLLLKKIMGYKRTVLTVLDEAQEFIPQKPIVSDATEESNRAVESLLRQGRKYRANCWICSQRVAHLNTNALQQLHSYFVSTLPRSYDRYVIAEAFGLSYDLVDATVSLETGEWLFVSYRATKQKNVPVFIRAPNNEGILTKGLAGRT
jgi:DNA helicase HerA-like ATPase